MISTVKSPQPPFAKGGRPLWLAVSSCFPLLQRGMEGDFHARGRQHFSVMNVYETINVWGHSCSKGAGQALPLCINSIEIELTSPAKSPLAPLSERAVIPPF